VSLALPGRAASARDGTVQRFTKASGRPDERTPRHRLHISARPTHGLEAQMTDLVTDAADLDEAAAAEVFVPVPAQEDLLVEDVSIDGMCGVY
jgi:mycofactocin precursor